MSQMILVQAEIDEQTKVSAEKCLRDQGIYPDEAIRIFYREIVACRGLPFSAPKGPAAKVGAEGPDVPPVFYHDVSAVSIPSVSNELRQAHLQGREMLELLNDFKEQRALRKAARKANRRNKIGA